MSYTQWALISAAMCVVGVVAGLLCTVFIPADHFVRHDPTRFRDRTPLGKLRVVAKNLLGIAFVVIGIALIVLPGQGLLTILVGLMLVDFPGKRGLVRKLMTRPHLIGTANRFRAKFGKPPIVTD